MSTVLVVTPLVIANWPAIAAAVSAAVGTMGFALARTAAQASGSSHLACTNRAQIDLQESEILPSAEGTAQSLTVERDGIRAIFSRDPRGTLRVCVEGAGYSKSELQRIGEELVGRVTQQYVYHRIVTELKERRMTIVGEQVEADRTVKIRVRGL